MSAIDADTDGKLFTNLKKKKIICYVTGRTALAGKFWVY